MQALCDLSWNLIGVSRFPSSRILPSRPLADKDRTIYITFARAIRLKRLRPECKTTGKPGRLPHTGREPERHQSGTTGPPGKQCMSLVWKLLNWVGLNERREDGRIPVHDFHVFYSAGSKQKRSRVKDMSAAGVYLFTDERWPPGTRVLLTLQRTGFLGQHSGPPLRLRTRSVRAGDDGVGLTFIPEPLDAVAWRDLMANAAALNARIPSAQNDILGHFRTAQALAFLIRICPSAEARILKLITEDLGDEKAIRAIEVGCIAEDLLDEQDEAAIGQVSPDLLLRILEVGSDANDDLIRHSWAGILASSSLAEAEEASSWRCVDLLTQFLPGHIQILTLACTRAAERGWEPGFIFREKIECPTAEVRRLTGIRDSTGIEQDLNHLHHLDLLEPTSKANSFEQIVDANITPTALGLKLFARCNGHANPPETPRARTLQLVS